VPTSMQRLDPGHYTINIGGTVYNVNKEDKRVPTGRSKRGTVKQVWVARRDDGYVLEESSRYRDAKNAVFADAELPKDQRPTASVSEPVTHEDGTEQPSLFESGSETAEVGQAPTVDESPAFVQHVQEDPVVSEPRLDYVPTEDNRSETVNQDQTSFSWA
jgi:hypothetical protein